MEAKVISQDSPKLLDRLRAEIRVRHYSLRTEHAYVDWARRFTLFHNKCHPNANERKITRNERNYRNTI